MTFPSNLEVEVADHGVDAVLLCHDDDTPPVLILQPYISFGAAVRAVVTVRPGTSADDARHLVRTHLPNAVDLDEMLPPPDPVEEPPGRFLGVFDTCALATAGIVMLMLAAGFFLIHTDARRNYTPPQRFGEWHETHPPRSGGAPHEATPLHWSDLVVP